MFFFQGQEILVEIKDDLIHLVHERKGLWSTNKNFYRDKIGKNNDWQDIADELKVKYRFPCQALSTELNRTESGNVCFELLKQ